MMDFNRSTQARSWLFDELSLEDCRRRAVCVGSESHVDWGVSDCKPRKFASGFHRRSRLNREETVSEYDTNLTVSEQEQVIRFHAQQMRSLVGGKAVLRELRNTSDKVLSTAITFLRRFYLSNSVAEIHPRKIAAACAFFAAKVEEEKIDIDLLAQASVLIETKVKVSPLCRKELVAVNAADIEEGELLLIEGLNYEFHCYHPDHTIRTLLSDTPECTDELLLEKAMEISRRVLIFSDATFLFPPDEIALAVVAFVMGVQVTDRGGIHDFLVSRYPQKTEEECQLLSVNVTEIIQHLFNCPSMELLRTTTPSTSSGNDTVKERVRELKTILRKVADVRHLLHQVQKQQNDSCSKKRSHGAEEIDISPPRKRFTTQKCAKVTPPTTSNKL